MSTVSQQYYTVVLKVPDYKIDTEDILNLYYARIPLQRTATLCYLTVSIPVDVYNTIHNNLEKNIDLTKKLIILKIINPHNVIIIKP